jgi:hypothetical protein
MKRHQVMDLFWCNVTQVVDGDWNKVENGLPICKSKGCKVWVKLEDNSECFAYFYDDMASFVRNSGIKPSYFWDCRSKEPLYNVKEWKALQV